MDLSNRQPGGPMGFEPRGAPGESGAPLAAPKRQMKIVDSLTLEELERQLRVVRESLRTAPETLPPSLSLDKDDAPGGDGLDIDCPSEFKDFQESLRKLSVVDLKKQIEDVERKLQGEMQRQNADFTASLNKPTKASATSAKNPRSTKKGVKKSKGGSLGGGKTGGKSKSQKKKYCICNGRYDDKGPMICCDGCNDWFHVNCVDLTPAESDELKTWLCPSCLSGHSPPKSKGTTSRTAKNLKKDPIETEYVKVIAKLTDIEIEDEIKKKEAELKLLIEEEKLQEMQRKVEEQEAKEKKIREMQQKRLELEQKLKSKEPHLETAFLQETEKFGEVLSVVQKKVATTQAAQASSVTRHANFNPITQRVAAGGKTNKIKRKPTKQKQAAIKKKIKKDGSVGGLRVLPGGKTGGKTGGKSGAHDRVRRGPKIKTTHPKKKKETAYITISDGSETESGNGQSQSSDGEDSSSGSSSSSGTDSNYDDSDSSDSSSDADDENSETESDCDSEGADSNLVEEVKMLMKKQKLSQKAVAQQAKLTGGATTLSAWLKGKHVHRVEEKEKQIKTWLRNLKRNKRKEKKEKKPKSDRKKAQKAPPAPQFPKGSPVDLKLGNGRWVSGRVEDVDALGTQFKVSYQLPGRQTQHEWVAKLAQRLAPIGTKAIHTPTKTKKKKVNVSKSKQRSRKLLVGMEHALHPSRFIAYQPSKPVTRRVSNFKKENRIVLEEKIDFKFTTDAPNSPRAASKKQVVLLLNSPDKLLVKSPQKGPKPANSSSSGSTIPGGTEISLSSASKDGSSEHTAIMGDMVAAGAGKRKGGGKTVRSPEKVQQIVLTTTTAVEDICQNCGIPGGSDTISCANEMCGKTFHKKCIYGPIDQEAIQGNFWLCSNCSLNAAKDVNSHDQDSLLTRKRDIDEWDLYTTVSKKTTKLPKLSDDTS